MEKSKTSFPISRNLLLLICFSLFTIHSSGQSDELTPEAIGRKLVEDLLSHNELMLYRSDFLNTVHYAEACAGMGAMRFSTSTSDTALISKLRERYSPLFSHFDTLPANHVDANVIGILPLAFYHWNKKEEFKDLGINMANTQWKNPQPDGLSNQTRYWIDDIYMIGILQVEAFRATGDTLYLVRAAKEVRAYLEKLQQPNGLFYHGPEAHFYWGRGNGWVAAGLAELLTVLPPDNENYGFIKEAYLKMMVSLLGYQTKGGMWRQLIDKENAWEESSCTAMFAYSMNLGIERGLLEKNIYHKAVERAWDALCSCIDERGNLTGICVGTGQSNDEGYYLARPKVSGDLHGQAPMLWLVNSLLHSR